MAAISNISGVVAAAMARRTQESMSSSTSDSFAEGSNNLYFTAQRAKDAVASEGYLRLSDLNGFTGTISLVTSVDFATETITTQSLVFNNGVLQN